MTEPRPTFLTPRDPIEEAALEHAAAERLAAADGAAMPWPFPAVTHDAWIDLAPGEAAKTLSIVQAAGHGRLAADVVAIRTAVPTFYDGRITLIEILGRDGEPAFAGRLSSALFAASAGFVVHLDGTSPPVHALNEAAPLVLATSHSILSYVRFFCSTVCGEDGAFTIVETLADLPGPVGPVVMAIVARVARDLFVDEVRGDGSALVSAALAYGRALFTVTFEVRRDGTLVMADDDVVAADLPMGRLSIIAGRRRPLPA